MDTSFSSNLHPQVLLDPFSMVEESIQGSPSLATVLVQAATVCQLDYFSCPQLVFAPPLLAVLVFILQLD